MSDAYRRYLDLFDELRRVREEHAEDTTAREAAERDIDDELDSLWDGLTDSEKASTGEHSWRAWPEEYARRSVVLAGHTDRSVWGRQRSPPRAATQAAA